MTTDARRKNDYPDMSVWFVIKNPRHANYNSLSYAVSLIQIDLEAAIEKHLGNNDWGLDRGIVRTDSLQISTILVPVNWNG